MGAEERLDLAILDAVFDVGLDPVLDVPVHSFIAMHQRDTRSAAPQFKCRNRRRVLPADHHDIRVEVGVRIVVVVMDLAQVLTRNTHEIGQIVVSSGDDQFARLQCAGSAEAVLGVHGESSVRARHPVDAPILAHIQLVISRDKPVILQRFVARRLGIRAGERDAADLEQLRRCKKRHVRRVVEERVADASLVNQHHAAARLLRFNRAGESGWPRADDQHVEQFVHVFSLGHGVGHGWRLRTHRASLVPHPLP